MKLRKPVRTLLHIYLIYQPTIFTSPIPPLLALLLFSLLPCLYPSQCITQQSLLLLHMLTLQPGCHTRTWSPSSIPDLPLTMMFRFTKHSLHPWLEECPCAGIKWLLLYPADILNIRISIKCVTELSIWERMELFDSCDGHIFKIFGGTGLVESGIDLPGANQQTLALLWWCDGLPVLGVGDDPFEMAVAGEVREGRAGEGVTEESLAEEKDKG